MGKKSAEYTIKPGDVIKPPQKENYITPEEVNQELSNMLDSLRINTKPTETSFVHKTWTHFIALLSSILHLPLSITFAITKLLKIRIISDKAIKATHYHPCCKDGKTDYLDVCNFKYFWKPCDINTDEDASVYKQCILKELKQWKSENDTNSWIRFQKEVKECYNSWFKKRLEIILTCVADERLCHEENIVELLANISKHAFLYNRCNFVKIVTDFEKKHEKCREAFSQIYIKKPYSVLHFAILNSHRQLMRDVFDFFDSEAQYQMANTKSSAPELIGASQLLINLAVWVGDNGIIEDLIQYGAELCLTDDNGFTPFHVVGKLNAVKPDIACGVFDTLMDQISIWIKTTRKCASLRDLCPHFQTIAAHRILLKAETKENELTPLKIAAAGKNDKLFTKIINTDNVFKLPSQKLGSKSTAMFDMVEIDPALNPNSTKPTVLDLLVLGYNTEHAQTVQHPVMCAILEAKLRFYWLYFSVAAFIHINIMLVYNVSAYTHILPFLLRNCSCPPGDNGPGHSRRFYFTWVDWFALGIACIYFAYFIICFTAIVKIAGRIRVPYQERAWMFNTLQQQTTFLFPVSIFVYLALKHFECYYEFLALSLSMLIGWIHCILFTRALGGIAFFSIMLHRLLFSDLLRFFFIIVLIAVSYTMATTYLFADVTNYHDDSSDTLPYLEYGPMLIFFDFIRLAAGISPFDELLTSHRYISSTLYLSFVFIANVLLFNMLIAAMSTKYKEINKIKHFHCYRIRMADIILLEMILPAHLQKRMRTIYRHLVVTLHITDDVKVSQDMYLLEAKDCDHN